jgi:hypothetical protein
MKNNAMHTDEKKILRLVLVGSLIATILSCNKDEKVVAPTIDNEALTTVQLFLTNSTDATDTTSAQWQQLLNNNGKPLPVDVSRANLVLKTNVTYSCQVIIWDKTQTPPANISNEIKARENYHLFFYQPLPTNLPLVIPNNYPANPDDIYPPPIPTPIPAGTALALAVTITDHDTNPQQYPVGLQSNFVTGAAGSGWLRLVLRHQPNAKNGTYAPGSTDLDVGFNVVIH